MQGMKLGVNNDVNTSTKKVGITHMASRPPKTNQSTSHPSNPIHKAAVAAQSGKKTTLATTHTDSESELAPTHTNFESQPAPTRIDSHHTNKATLAVGAVALGGLIVWMR